MKAPATTLTLSASFAALAATPAFAADGASAPAIMSTGGSIALIGFALVGAGTLMLARGRNAAAQHTAVDMATAEAAATAAPAAGQAERLFRAPNAGADTSRGDGETYYYSQPTSEETVVYRGGVLKAASAQKTVVVGVTNTQDEFADDDVAQQMLEALRAEQARRHG